MQSFDQALVQLVKEDLVSVEDARRAATSPHDFDLQLAGVLDRRAGYTDEQQATGVAF
jgi:Tfp pilus assembly ATPase PilU